MLVQRRTAGRLFSAVLVSASMLWMLPAALAQDATTSQACHRNKWRH